jgi:hypothetical protein
MDFLYQNSKMELDPYVEYMGIGATVFKMFLTYLKENQ